MTYAAHIAEADAARERAGDAASPSPAEQEEIAYAAALRMAEHLSWTSLRMVPDPLKGQFSRLALAGVIELRIERNGDAFFRFPKAATKGEF